MTNTTLGISLLALVVAVGSVFLLMFTVLSLQQKASFPTVPGALVELCADYDATPSGLYDVNITTGMASRIGDTLAEKLPTPDRLYVLGYPVGPCGQ